MSNQYEVLGKAPSPEDLKKLSSDEIHLTIKNLSAGYGKMEILHNFDLFVNKAQSLCLIGPNVRVNLQYFIQYMDLQTYFQAKLKLMEKKLQIYHQLKN